MNRVIKLVFLSISLFVFSNAVADGRISKIIVDGNQRIETSTIKEYSGFHEGQQFSLEAQNDAIKNLYATSLFEDISINFENGILKVIVKETSFVSKVTFVGNSKIKSAMLANEISTVAGESLRKAKLRADIEKIKEMYKRSGRFSVDVKSKIEDQGNNAVKVIFQITEGPKQV